VHEVDGNSPGEHLGSLGTLVQIHCKKPFSMLVYFELGDPRGWTPGNIDITSPIRYRFDGPSSVCVSPSELPPNLAGPPIQTQVSVELRDVTGEAAPPPALVTRGFLRALTVELEMDQPLVGFAGLQVLGGCGRALEKVSMVADVTMDEDVMLRDLDRMCTSISH